jgi:translation initiation factor 1 (eIF-1/SUI1)
LSTSSAASRWVSTGIDKNNDPPKDLKIARDIAMGKQLPPKKQEDPGKAKDFKVNPFSALKVAGLAAAPATPPPAAPPVPPAQARLSPADRELLAQMGGEVETEIGGKPRGPRVTFQYERKGHGGKEATLVRGLDSLSLDEQMTLARKLKKELGVGAWFDEVGLLLVQGNQVERLGKWFAAAGYRV